MSKIYYLSGNPIAAIENAVSNYVYNHYVIDSGDDIFRVRIVWFCYILGGWKAMACTDLPDERYFEITYNKNKNEIYLDVYDKFENVVIDCA